MMERPYDRAVDAMKVAATDCQSELDRIETVRGRVADSLRELLTEAQQLVSEFGASSPVSVTETNEAGRTTSVTLRVGDYTVHFSLGQDGAVVARAQHERKGDVALQVRQYRGEGSAPLAQLARIIPSGTEHGPHCTLYFTTGSTSVLGVAFVEVVAQLLDDERDELLQRRRRAELKAYGQVTQ